MNRIFSLGRRRVAALACVAAVASAPAAAEDPIRIGVLHSLSGTMAISETTLKDTILMMVDDLNASAACSGARSRRWSSTPPPTGRSSPRRPAN